MKKLQDFIGDLKKIHDVYVIGTNDQKNRIFIASSHIIGNLVSLGFDRAFIESTLMFGKEFLLSEGIDPKGLWSLFFI